MIHLPITNTYVKKRIEYADWLRLSAAQKAELEARLKLKQTRK